MAEAGWLRADEHDSVLGGGLGPAVDPAISQRAAAGEDEGGDAGDQPEQVHVPSRGRKSGVCRRGDRER